MNPKKTFFANFQAFYSPTVNANTISFRTFELSLIPRPELFSQNFKAVTVGSDGTEKEFKVNKNDFYHGYVKG